MHRGARVVVTVGEREWVRARSHRQIGHDNSDNHERERGGLVPAEPLAEVQPSESHEHEQGDYLLDDLELWPRRTEPWLVPAC